MQVELANKLPLRDKINWGSSHISFFGILAVLNMCTVFCAKLGLLRSKGIFLGRHGVFDLDDGVEDGLLRDDEKSCIYPSSLAEGKRII